MDATNVPEATYLQGVPLAGQITSFTGRAKTARAVWEDFALRLPGAPL